MAAFDRITCAAIAVVKVVVSQMRFEVDASWHAPVLQLHAATRYESDRSPKATWYVRMAVHTLAPFAALRAEDETTVQLEPPAHEVSAAALREAEAFWRRLIA